ncbi:MAG TPA: beta-ketoacyl synthase N-terminal-like domain-containing protein, partial [Alphaproteobacteria bacterium]|nr:beta-ketoacyl synthase N-terminal-like domain-containing protein [Alphaproteobacteria bacterium]
MQPNNNASDIVIVSAGAVLPGADNPKQYWDNAMAGHSAVCDLTKADNSFRPYSALVFDPRRGIPDASYTTMGAPVSRSRLVEIAKTIDVPFDENMMQHVMAIEAVRQCVENILPADARAETDFVFGRPSMPANCINQHLDEAIKRIKQSGGEDLLPLLEPELERFKFLRNRNDEVESMSVTMRQRFGFGGIAIRTDAACASALAAFYTASLRLRAGLARYAVVGGADDNLGHVGALIAFSQLGVLTSKMPRPFDRKAEGMALGEGSVAFLITTLGEARRAKLPILGIVKNIDGSSDGKQGGLTEPTVEGQALCYNRVYGGDVPVMDYIETHGTGTKVGDQTELNSLAAFFNATPELPVGSSKWNVGHTMGTAGAAGLLRALGVLERKTVPPSPYFENFPDSKKTNLAVGKDKATLGKSKNPINIGVSSFGFGGANFHLWLQDYRNADIAALPAPAPKYEDVVLCAEAEADISDVADLFRSTSYRLPPKVWPFIDKVQLLSVLLAEKTFRDNGINPATLDGDAVHVIADSGISLELNRELSDRVATQYALQYMANANPEKKSQIDDVRKKALGSFSEINDQFILGGLVSLVASRVTKAFNFRGVNFGIEADYACGPIAGETARTILQLSSGAA